MRSRAGASTGRQGVPDFHSSGRAAKADPSGYSFEINGFTDSAGTSKENLEMSRVRAFTVHNYRVNSGVDESMLETRYFGETEDFLIVRNERTAADRDRSRRVTLLLRHH